MYVCMYVDTYTYPLQNHGYCGPYVNGKCGIKKKAPTP